MSHGLTFPIILRKINTSKVNGTNREGGILLDLSTPTVDNITKMINDMKDKLRMANIEAMQAEDFATDRYEDLVFIHKMVMKRDYISANEMEAIVSELGSLRK